ncbi:MAG: NERD domain-containing protein [candidate division NC10 bacterium]|nr:NERD domain-containing protein [candidate division NC10 bacterium]
MTKETDKRSPLRNRPLRYAGQSLDEKIDDLIDESRTSALYPLWFVALAAFDWVRRITKAPLNPWLFTVMALVAAGYTTFRWWRARQKLAQLKLGRDGEKIVAENLEVLKQHGDTVLHDVVGDSFNIDHVVLSQHGVFLIETKTLSKPVRGNPMIAFDGHKVLVDGIEPDRDPIAQASALAKWLEQTLLASTGKRFPVRPVVVFPGWYVEPMPKGTQTWVLNPKALPTFVQNEPVVISDSDLHLAAFHLTRYIRTYA